MATDGLVDTSGDRPSIVWGAVASTGVGTIIWANLQGIVASIRGVGRAFATAVGRLELYWADLIGAIFGIGESGFAALWDANAAFLAGFGPWAPLAAIAEVLVFIALMLAIFGKGVGWMEGAFT